jgi:hypothetical protein
MLGALTLLRRKQVNEFIHLFIKERPAALNVLH